MASAYGLAAGGPGRAGAGMCFAECVDDAYSSDFSATWFLTTVDLMTM